MAAAAQRLILGAADRVAVGSDASPVVGGVAQPVVGSQAAHHEQAFSRTPGDRRHPAETAKRVVVPPPQRVATLGKQRSEDAGADAGQREQDGRLGRRWRRLWLGLGGRVRVFRRCGLGELVSVVRPRPDFGCVSPILSDVPYDGRTPDECRERTMLVYSRETDAEPAETRTLNGGFIGLTTPAEQERTMRERYGTPDSTY